MTLQVTDTGEKIGLEALVNKTAPQDLIMKLYKNDATLSDSTVAGDLTVANFTGYEDKDLTGLWNEATIGDPSYIDAPKQTFTSTAGSQNQPIYGYYIVQKVSGILVWVEEFTDGPYTIVNNGDKIECTPRIEAS